MNRIDQIHDHIINYDYDLAVFETCRIYWLTAEHEWVFLAQDGDEQIWRIAGLERCLDWVPEEELEEWYLEYVAEEEVA
jgi:hypothetical protein